MRKHIAPEPRRGGIGIWPVDGLVNRCVHAAMSRVMSLRRFTADPEFRVDQASWGPRPAKAPGFTPTPLRGWAFAIVPRSQAPLGTASLEALLPELEAELRARGFPSRAREPAL